MIKRESRRVAGDSKPSSSVRAFGQSRAGHSVRITAGCLLSLACLGGCTPEGAGDATETVTSAIVSSASLQLKVLTNSCGANQMQDFFQVVNTGTATVKLSDIKIKLWADDTSGQSLAPHVSTGGCVTGVNGNPSCVHQVAAVTATPTSFGPACGPDSSHQANWEITLSTTDSSTLVPGAIWNNLQTSLNLANFSNFTPGTAAWYSGCLPGSSYVSDPHFALYYQGNLVYANGVNAPDCRAPKGTRQLTGFRTPQITAAPFVRPVPETTPITLSLSLPVRQPTGFPTLPDLVNQVSDPASPQYRQYVSQQDFTDRYAPTPTDYQAIVGWAQLMGLTVHTVSTRMVVSATGPASAIKKALYVNLNFYQRPDGSLFFAPDREPSLDLNTPLLDIGALDSYVARTPTDVVTDWGSNRILNNGYGLGDGTFGFGQGECVGLNVDDGFSLSDLTRLNSGRTVYTAHPDLVPPSFRAVLLNPAYVAGQPAPLGCSDGTLCGPKTGCPAASPNCCLKPDPTKPSNLLVESTCPAACTAAAGTAITGSTCPSGGGGAEEVALDMDMSMALAPGLKEIVLYEGGTTDATLAQMAADPAKCHQLSTSFIMGVEPRTVDLLRQLAAQGQALSSGSGDDGAQSDQGDIRRLAEVTVVGGTVLTGTSEAADPAVYDYTSETPWIQSGSFFADGSSGLMAIPIPAYQQGVNMSFCASGTYCNGSTKFRNVPDIAMVGSQMQISFNGLLFDVDGTSISSPLWASFLAVTNSYGSKNGVLPVGFVNPAIYAIGKTAGTANDVYKDTFHDLASGDATNFYSPACSSTHNCGAPRVPTKAWPAVAGYDLASGWGSPKPKLIQALTTGLPSGNIIKVVSGDVHSCALLTDGSVSCWGDDERGELGDNLASKNFSAVAVKANTPTGVVALSANGLETCALLKDGTVDCWGWDKDGQIGVPSAPANGPFGDPCAPVPVAVQGLTGVTSLSVGLNFACAVTGGLVKCWGSNDSFKLGNGGNSTSTPTTVAGITTATTVATGASHACATLSDGTVRCWGANFDGQLGNGTFGLSSSTPTPVTVTGLSGAASLALGNGHSCALLSTGEVKCWGTGEFGELGIRQMDTNQCADPSCVLTPVSVLTGASSISAGTDYTCAIVGNNVECIGSGLFGNLGLGNLFDSAVFTPVPGLGVVNSVGAGSGHVCAGLADFRVACWGDNVSADLGDASCATGANCQLSNSPVFVQQL